MLPMEDNTVGQDKLFYNELSTALTKVEGVASADGPLITLDLRNCQIHQKHSAR